jgi:hypothetical protein
MPGAYVGGTETGSRGFTRPRRDLLIHDVKLGQVEVDLGVVPADVGTRDYRDTLGRVNAIFAEAAELALFVAAGRVLQLRPARRGPGGDGMSTDLDATLLEIEPRNQEVERAARCEFDRKTTPRGSLGRLEELACRIAGIRRKLAPSPDGAAVVVIASDHGVAIRGVSAYPQEVTAQMLRTFASGGAAICVLAKRAGARLVVVDAGTRRAQDPPRPVAPVRGRDRRHGRGGRRWTARRAIGAGISLVEKLARRWVERPARPSGSDPTTLPFRTGVRGGCDAGLRPPWEDGSQARRATWTSTSRSPLKTASA